MKCLACITPILLVSGGVAIAAEVNKIKVYVISRHEKSMAARQAFDEWASRLRGFLNAAHELKGEDIKRAEESYQPYGSAPAAK